MFKSFCADGEVGLLPACMSIPLDGFSTGLQACVAVVKVNVTAVRRAGLRFDGAGTKVSWDTALIGYMESENPLVLRMEYL